ncbi:MAG: hypothetical protein ACE5PM_06200 [Candidatus Hydrothermarchaeales archaeon]
MDKCKYCGAPAESEFVYGGYKFRVCSMCSRCFFCGETIKPGEEQFYAQSYELIDYAVGRLQAMNVRVLLGVRDFGIILHKRCVKCAECNLKIAPKEAYVYALPSGRITLLCKDCDEKLRRSQGAPYLGPS